MNWTVKKEQRKLKEEEIIEKKRQAIERVKQKLGSDETEDKKKKWHLDQSLDDICEHNSMHILFISFSL